MDVVYFVILVGTLVFVHELGHFLFAKAFGVKVLTFSLGFGPKLLRLRGRETEYCVGAFPLGGYVKLLEASKSDLVYPEDRHRTFEALPLFKRVVVVLAGPAMNLLFPVLLYFTVFATEGPQLPPTVGVVQPGHAADGLLFPGDRIMSIDGTLISTFDEVKRIVRRSPGKPLRLVVFRDLKHVTVEVTPEEIIERRELELVERTGSLGIEASAPAAVVGIDDGDSPAFRASLRTFDVITHVAGQRVRRFMDLEQELGANRGETVPVTYLRPTPVHDALGGLAEMAVYEAGVVALTPKPGTGSIKDRTGIELADLYAAIVPVGSYFYDADLRPGDRIHSLDGEPVTAWSAFTERVLREPDQPHSFEFSRASDRVPRSGSFQVRREEFIDDRGQAYARYVLPVRHWVPLAPEERAYPAAPLLNAWEKAWEVSSDATRLTVVGFIRILQGKVSLSSISGPITIYEVAGEEGRRGTDYFLWVMAFISINLGLLNLLPIPVLDGGHLLFFLVEAIRRRPIPMRFREMAHILGMGVVLSLMVVALTNDLSRTQWNIVAEQLGQLFR